ncbi:UNVERIFIED_CONTAM: hypothetical protein PYX00_009051 [Menopon gallinae]|uniref:CBM39 domain-containing protein n=1 Tax=Menopon gallinae TaxID=328185 RepID=A0AAW2HA53_9NEOP
MTMLTVALVGLSAVLSCAGAFDVPEPVFEVFHPKGLRVSIPDVEGVQSVQFLLNVKSLEEGKTEEMFDDPDKPEDGRWTFWNPDAVLQVDDQIYYKVTVEYDDLYWNKEGEHTVDKAFSVDGGVEEQRRGLLGFGGLQNPSMFRNRNLGLVTEGKKSSYHSSYSSYQSPDSKPVTRSSTTSATGTYVMHPNGEIEASGYKKSESYDSTKREGEQWEMSESEMTADELEELKKFIGPNFRSFSELTKGQVEEFKRLHGMNFHIPERLRNERPESHHAGGVHSYEQSYFSKETSSSRSQGQGSDYRRPSTYPQGYISPAPFSSAGHIRAPETNRYEEHRHDYQSSSSIARPAVLSNIDDSDHQQTVPATFPSSRQTTRNLEYSQSESHRVAANRASTRPVPEPNPSPSYLQESVTNRENAYSHHRENYDEQVQAVERPKYQAESHYKGSIFRSITSSRANRPEECFAWAETNYDHVTDLNEIQKSISKMSCLAAMAEHSLKEELRLLKQQNSDMSRKLESLDREFRRYKDSCGCSG